MTEYLLNKSKKDKIYFEYSKNSIIFSSPLRDSYCINIFG